MGTKFSGTVKSIWDICLAYVTFINSANRIDFHFRKLKFNWFSGLLLMFVSRSAEQKHSISGPH